MRKKACWLVVLAAGTTMLLLACAWLVRTTHAQRADSYQHLRMEDAVAQLEGCLTCHTITNTNPPVDNHPALVMASHTEIYLPDAAEPSSHLKIDLDARLLDLGKRLLAVPESDGTLYQAAATGFLQVYDQTRTTSDPVVLVGALHALDGVEDLLRQAENQAQPLKWQSAPTSPAPDSPAVVPSAPLSGVVNQPSGAVALARHASALSLPAEIAVPVLFVTDASRRGPPAPGAESYHVWKRRLPHGAQSSFLFESTTNRC